MMTRTTTNPRRWLQFSLRTLFVVMLLVAAFFGGRESMRPAIEIERMQAAKEARELAEIERNERIKAVEEGLVAKMQLQAAEMRLRVRDEKAPRSR